MELSFSGSTALCITWVVFAIFNDIFFSLQYTVYSILYKVVNNSSVCVAAETVHSQTNIVNDVLIAVRELAFGCKCVPDKPYARQ